MKKLKFVLIALMVASFTCSFGQNTSKGNSSNRSGNKKTKSEQKQAQKETAKIQKNLDLTKDQNAKVYAINLYIAQQRDANWKRGYRKANQQLLRKLETDRQNKIMNVLNQDQQSRYNEELQKEYARHPNTMQYPPGNGVGQ